MNELHLPTMYYLRSLVTGDTFEDEGWMLEAAGEPKPSLLSSVYDKVQLTVKDTRFGIYKFADWLPLHRILEGSSAPVTYKSEKLARQLGLKNLYITFSGYWPDRGALMRTCSFKETEAYSVCARLGPEQHQTLVVASAGNTARSFARVCSDNHIPLLLSVPSDTLNALWFDTPLNDCVTLISPPPGCDYYDAIHLSNLVCQLDGFIPEGGAKNIARRDGMATTVLSAATTIGRIPDIYFQAVGSGTGAIAAWEANLRLIADGRFGSYKMKLYLSQNFPFHPMVDAWKARSRDLFPMDDQLAREQVMQIDAKVLSNRKPPYGIIGGLFDALLDTDGEMVFVTNEEASEAARLFEDEEGIDIHPAAAVATASLIQAAGNNVVSKDEVIMLNITGGGEARFREDKEELVYLKPSLIINTDVTLRELEKMIRAI
ncbi:MAG: cysteate synthase [Bacteroidales bacterium]|nr:cysteate synthase [Bacteroidales bacterium]